MIRPKVSQLTGRSVDLSYQRLITLNHRSGGDGTNLVEVKDGDGDTTFPIKVASNQIQITDGSNDFDVASHDTSNGLKLGGTLVTSTAAELNYNDTGSALGTVVASKTVTVDANKDVASFRNITLTGELDANSLDIEGDADINGTLEADAITVNGSTLNDVIDARLGSNIVATGALDSGSITSGFGNIDVGSSNLTATGTISLGATSFNDNDISNVGDISLDTISSDAGTSIGVTLGTDAGDDFNVGSGKLVVEGDTSQTGINTATPNEKLEVNGGIMATNSANRSAGEGIVIDYVTGSDLGRITVGDWGTAYEELQIEAEKYTVDVGGSGNIMTHHITNTGSHMFSSSTGVGKIGANVVSVADDSTIALTDNDGSIAHVYVYERSSGSGGIFTVGYSPASAVVVSRGYNFSATDTDGAICVISTINSHTITFKNRIGSTANFRIMMVGAGSPATI